MSDNPYWNSYYDTNDQSILNPSSFAIDIAQRILKNPKCILEVGCGNGRDLRYFNSLGNVCHGFDASQVVLTNQSNDTLSYHQKNVNDIGEEIEKIKPDVIYTRFFLHSIKYDEMIKFIAASFDHLEKDSYFVFETRSVNDPLCGKGSQAPNEEDAWYTSHYRRHMRIEDVKNIMEGLGFHIEFIEENFTDSWHKDDHAVVIRVIAKR